MNKKSSKIILFFISDLTGGGAQRVLVNLTNALVADGYIIVIATNTDASIAFPIHPEIQILNFREGCNTSGFKSKIGIYRKLKAYCNIREISRKVSPDIIVSFLREMNLDVLLATKGLRIPVICSEHTTVRRKKVTFVVSLLYKTASAITVLTKSDYNFIRRLLPNLVYMPNPSDRKINFQDVERKKIVLAAGRVNDWFVKGFDNLLRCWGLICHDFPEWSLCIAGGGENVAFNKLHSIAMEYNCTNYEFLGFRSDINDLMLSSAVFCLSSRFEGLPMVLIEAMNSGCCCVSFDCFTGPSEIIRNGKNGVLVESQNVIEMAGALRQVMNNETLRHHFSEMAPQTVKQYSSERVLRRWKILFDKILKK